MPSKDNKEVSATSAAAAAASGLSSLASSTRIYHSSTDARSSHEDRSTSWLRRLSPRWASLTIVTLLTLGAAAELMLENGGSLLLRAATLRAAGGSARLGARGIFVLRVGEAVVLWALLCCTRRDGRGCCCSSRRGGGGGGGTSAGLSASPSALCEAGLAHEPWPSAVEGSSVHSYPREVEQMRPGASLLCTLSGWVCAVLGCFSVTGSVCSLLVAMGGRTAPGMLGEMFSHHGPLARRSLLGWSLPTLTWLFFEIGSAGALYIATLSLLTLLRQCISSLWARLCGHGVGGSAPSALCAHLQSCTRLCAAGGAEPPLSQKLQSLVVHMIALLISFAELSLNDLPVLWQHRPLAVLMGCAFSVNLLAWHTYHGRFTYMYADAPRTSAPSILLACVITPAALAAAFAALASLSASTRVRGP